MDTTPKIRKNVFIVEELLAWLRARAVKNKRSFSGELEIILEAARDAEERDG